jgi:hypothetical protein
MIDVIYLHQSYKRREITECRWIEGTLNPANTITKKAPYAALKRLIDENKVSTESKE